MSHRFESSSARVLLWASVLVSGCEHALPDARQLPPVVRVTEVGPMELAERAFTGVVSARVESDIAFRVPGKVVARLVNSGQAVRRGQALVRIDEADLRLQASARAAEVEAARARALQAAADELRYRRMAAQGSMAVLAYEQSRTAAAAAAAELRAAEANARAARNAAAYATVWADADGVVVETLTEPGQVVAAGQPVVRLAHSGPREATVDLPETVRPALGAAAMARIYGDGVQASRAHLRQLSASANPSTRTYEARFVLEGAAAEAALGSTVTIHLPAGAASPTVRVPLSAVTDRGRGPGVWIVNSRGDSVARVTWRSVKLVGLDNEMADVGSGLRPGERFVAMGAHLLHEADRVRTVAVGGAGAPLERLR